MSIAQCRNDYVYSGFNIGNDFQPRFSVTAVNNATHVGRDLDVNSTQLTDSGVYLCAEQRRGIGIVDTSTAQLIVLGNCIGIIQPYNYYYFILFIFFFVFFSAQGTQFPRAEILN